METKHRAWGIAAFAALLFAGLMASGAQCGIPGLPGSKKGMKVAKVKELDSIIVKTKEDSALTPAEYQTVVLEGVGLPSAFDNKAREGMGRALTEMVEGKYVTLEYDSVAACGPITWKSRKIPGATTMRMTTMTAGRTRTMTATLTRAK
jgi:hypothetical protein